MARYFGSCRTALIELSVCMISLPRTHRHEIYLCVNSDFYNEDH